LSKQPEPRVSTSCGSGSGLRCYTIRSLWQALPSTCGRLFRKAQCKAGDGKGGGTSWLRELHCEMRQARDGPARRGGRKPALTESPEWSKLRTAKTMRLVWISGSGSSWGKARRRRTWHRYHL